MPKKRRETKKIERLPKRMKWPHLPLEPGESIKRRRIRSNFYLNEEEKVLGKGSDGIVFGKINGKHVFKLYHSSSPGKKCLQARADLQLLRFLRKIGCRVVPGVRIVNVRGFEVLRQKNLAVKGASLFNLSKDGLKKLEGILRSIARKNPKTIERLFLRIEADFQRALSHGIIIGKDAFIITVLINPSTKKPIVSYFIVDVSKILRRSQFKSEKKFEEKVKRVKRQYAELLRFAQKIIEGK
jgi:hypothetical protein